MTEPSEKLNKVIVYRSKSKIRRSELWRWRFEHFNGNVLARSSEGYSNLGDLLIALATVLGVSPSAVFDMEGMQQLGHSLEKVSRPGVPSVLVAI